MLTDEKQVEIRSDQSVWSICVKLMVFFREGSNQKNYKC